MDLIDGGTLADELRRQRRLLPSRAVRIVRQIAAAIVHAHGLARDAAAAGARTLTGELLGTPAYMSPEQARGDSARIGEASDVWALGALLYELLTGRSPFAGKPLHETIRAILEDEPVPPRKLDARIPSELEAVCLQALRKRPEDRYATALARTPRRPWPAGAGGLDDRCARPAARAARPGDRRVGSGSRRSPPVRRCFGIGCVPPGTAEHFHRAPFLIHERPHRDLAVHRRTSAVGDAAGDSQLGMPAGPLCCRHPQLRCEGMTRLDAPVATSGGPRAQSIPGGA